MSYHFTRRPVAIALACAFPAFASLSSFAQAPAPSTATDAAVADDAGQRIVVTGSREPTATSRLAGDIVVIDAEQIQASTADSLEDLLRREAGLALSRN